MRCFDRLSMTVGMSWDEMLRQAQHDSVVGWGGMLRRAQHDNVVVGRNKKTVLISQSVQLFKVNFYFNQLS